MYTVNFSFLIPRYTLYVHTTPLLTLKMRIKLTYEIQSKTLLCAKIKRFFRKITTHTWNFSVLALFADTMCT